MSSPNVYGVLVPNSDGRACCIAVELDTPLDFKKIAAHAAKTLPKYARPLFIRVVAVAENTGTQKQMKTTLRKEGIDPAVVSDPLYWFQGDTYKPFTLRDYGALEKGARL